VRGLDPATAKRDTLGARERTQWADEAGAVALDLNIIASLNHDWAITAHGPDAGGAPGPYLAEAGLSASAEILRFWGLIGAPARADETAKPETPALQAVLAPRRRAETASGNPARRLGAYLAGKARTLFR
jgi:hypothetical protein